MLISTTFRHYFGLRKIIHLLYSVYATTRKSRSSIIYPFLATYLSLCVRALLNARRRSRSPIRDPRSQSEWSRIGHLAPTLARTAMILRSFSRYYLRLFPPVRFAPSPALSLLFSFPSSTRRSKEAKVEANHHAITAPGAAGTPTRSQKAATAFCRPGAFTTAVPVLQNQQSSSCAAEKRALPSPRPVPRPFSPNHRRADRSSDYWHPGNPSRE